MHVLETLLMVSLVIYWQPAPMFTFANNAGLDILETTLVNLQDISLEMILDDEGRKALCLEFPKIMQQVKPPCPCLATIGDASIRVLPDHEQCS